MTNFKLQSKGGKTLFIFLLSEGNIGLYLPPNPYK